MPLIVAATLSACSATPPPPVSGSATITETADFAEVNLAVETLNARYGAANVLIVSDIDNTLLTIWVAISGISGNGESWM